MLFFFFSTTSSFKPQPLFTLLDCGKKMWICEICTSFYVIFKLNQTPAMFLMHLEFPWVWVVVRTAWWRHVITSSFLQLFGSSGVITADISGGFIAVDQRLTRSPPFRCPELIKGSHHCCQGFIIIKTIKVGQLQRLNHNKQSSWWKVQQDSQPQCFNEQTVPG